MSYLLQEIWKPVEGYEGLYEISNYGKLKSYYDKNGRQMIAEGRLLKGKKDKDGYIEYTLSKNKVYKCKRAHRLVASAFIENPYNLPQVNHIDGIKSNNYVSNLEWCDVKHNAKHKYDTGLGEYSRHMAKMTHGRKSKLLNLENGDVIHFNSMYDVDLYLGKRYGFTKDTVRRNKNYNDKFKKLGYKILLEGE
ncbi:NUMOD4 domain-containing protein [Lysinibacillus sp. FSL K6-0057]|uniref:NUMOD4 domain-containing protein n=1 Tax=Lysinibacillus sp. FSL K6-0057 TaxID=2921411 RepID=UPI00315AD4C3